MRSGRFNGQLTKFHLGNDHNTELFLRRRRPVNDKALCTRRTQVLQQRDLRRQSWAPVALRRQSPGYLLAMEVREVVKCVVPIDISAIRHEASVPGDRDGS